MSEENFPTMGLYVSKPNTVEAVQWTGDNWKQLKHDLWQGKTIGAARFAGERPDLELWVEKSLAWCLLAVGDWIVREADGIGFYPCKPEVFEAKYEPLSEARCDLCGGSYHGDLRCEANV